MSDSDSAASSGSDGRIDVYETDVTNDQWQQAPHAGEPHPESDAARLADSTAQQVSDDELTRVEVQGRDKDAEIPMTVLAELDNGDTVVQTSKGRTGPASNDAKTSDGLGAEFGRGWSTEFLMFNKSAGEPNGHLEGSMPGGRWSAVALPDGQTLAGRERIAAREAHLTHISELARNPATDEGGAIDPRRREEVEERRHQHARQCREAVSRMDFPSYTSPAFSRFGSDEIHEQAREDSEKHRALGYMHLSSSDAMFDERWTDDTRPGAAVRAPRRVEQPPLVFDPDADVIEQLTVKVLDTVAGNPYTDDTDGGTEMAERFGVDIQTIRRKVREAYPDDPENPRGAQMSTVIEVTRDLFTGDGKHLDEIEPYWPAATAWLKVERRIDHSHDAIQQVVYVSDVAPNVSQTSVGGETAKLTIWDASDLSVPALYPGDIIHAKNVKPGRYRQQLTLAATGSSVVDLVDEGDAPERYQNPDATPGQSPQRLDAVSTGGPSGDGVTVSMARYRQPWETHVTDELAYNESAAVAGGVKHRDPTWTRTDWQVPVSWQPDWKRARPDVTPIARTMAGAAGTGGERPETPGAGEYAPKSRQDLARWVLEVNQQLDARLTAADEPSAEHILEVPVSSERPVYLKVYTTLIGEWTAPKDAARVLVTVENHETCSIGLIDRFNRTDGWLDRLEATITSHVQTS